MNFCWCTIHVKNMKESLKFYREIVGLEIDRNIKGEDGLEIYFLGKGETKVELIYDNSEVNSPIGQHVSLGFEVESVDQKMAFMKENNIPVHSGPFEPNPYIKFFYVTDPNGFKIQFVENKQ